MRNARARKHRFFPNDPRAPEPMNSRESAPSATQVQLAIAPPARQARATPPSVRRLLARLPLRRHGLERRPVLPLDLRQDHRPLGRRPCARPDAGLSPPDEPLEAQLAAEVGKGRMVGHAGHDSGGGGRLRRAYLSRSPQRRSPERCRGSCCFERRDQFALRLRLTPSPTRPSPSSPSVAGSGTGTPKASVERLARIA